jgi:hypothetical protein
MEHRHTAGISAAYTLIPAVVLCTFVMSAIASAETPKMQLADSHLVKGGSLETTETFGLSEEQRQEVFRESLAGEERAEKEASEQHRDDPVSMKEVNAEQSLANQYQDAVARKFSITRKQVVLIVAEGYEKEWSTTPPGGEVKQLD